MCHTTFWGIGNFAYSQVIPARYSRVHENRLETRSSNVDNWRPPTLLNPKDKLVSRQIEFQLLMFGVPY